MWPNFISQLHIVDTDFNQTNQFSFLCKQDFFNASDSVLLHTYYKLCIHVPGNTL